MTLSVSHAFNCAVPDDPQSAALGEVLPSHWNAAHTLTGQASATQLNANVVQGITNDTNVTGSIAAQVLTLAWAGTLTVARGGTGGGSASGTLLDNITGFGSTGLLARTAAGAYAFRTLTAPAAGITVSNGDGVAGNPTLALANDLAALEGLGSTGIAVRTAADTWNQRTIAGTANEITLTNGDGVAGNPTVSLPAALTFTGKTVTGGTFSAPTITGGTHTAITSLGIRSTGTGAFDVTLANSENLTAGRTLTLTLNDAARTINLAGNLTLAGALVTSGAFSLTLTATAATNVTLPTTGTLATLAGAEEFTNKTLTAAVGKGTWTASGTWTLPAYTLGGTVTGNSQTISGIGSLIIGTPPTITGGLVYNGGSDRVFAFGLAVDGPIMTAVNAANSANVPIYIDASTINLRPSGTNKFSVGADVTVRPDIATPAAGSTSARLLFGTTAGFGIYYGSGAPTVSAAQGSIYLRSDGSSTSTRLYANTNGSTTWTNFTSAA